MKLENVLAFKASSSIDYHQRATLLVVGLDLYFAQVLYVPPVVNKVQLTFIKVPFIPSKVKLEFVALVLTARFLYSQPAQTTLSSLFSIHSGCWFVPGYSSFMN